MAKRSGVEDNDWIEVFNAKQSLTARAVESASSRMTSMMYHARERIVKTCVGFEKLLLHKSARGSHYLRTRITSKPTSAGGYGHAGLLNGTAGSNRDEFVVVRKMKNINWLDERRQRWVQGEQNEKFVTSRHGAESR